MGRPNYVLVRLKNLRVHRHYLSEGAKPQYVDMINEWSIVMGNNKAKLMPDQSWYGNPHGQWNARYDQVGEVVI